MWRADFSLNHSNSIVMIREFCTRFVPIFLTWRKTTTKKKKKRKSIKQSNRLTSQTWSMIGIKKMLDFCFFFFCHFQSLIECHFIRAISAIIVWYSFWLIFVWEEAQSVWWKSFKLFNLYGSYQRQISPMCGNHVKSLALNLNKMNLVADKIRFYVWLCIASWEFYAMNEMCERHFITNRIYTGEIKLTLTH